MPEADLVPLADVVKVAPGQPLADPLVQASHQLGLHRLGEGEAPALLHVDWPATESTG